MLLSSTSVIIIIDFDNTFKKDIESYTTEIFEYTLKDIIKKSLKVSPGTKRILIRLYGGWHKDGILTSRASQIQQLIAKVNLFPIIHSTTIVNGNIELASSLFSIPQHIWTHTYKEKNGIPRIRINMELLSDNCSHNRMQCPPLILYNFTANKSKTCAVNSCSHIHKNIIKGIEQKMVDTLIACDIISFSKEKNADSIHVYSDDIDLLPSLAIASQNISESTHINLYIKNSRNQDIIEIMLNPFNVNILIHNYE